MRGHEQHVCLDLVLAYLSFFLGIGIVVCEKLQRGLVLALLVLFERFVPELSVLLLHGSDFSSLLLLASG